MNADYQSEYRMRLNHSSMSVVSDMPFIRIGLHTFLA